MDYYSTRKKEENSAICSMGELWEYYAKWNESGENDKYCIRPLLYGIKKKMNSE